MIIVFIGFICVNLIREGQRYMYIASNVLDSYFELLVITLTMMQNLPCCLNLVRCLEHIHLTHLSDDNKPIDPNILFANYVKMY